MVERFKINLAERQIEITMTNEQLIVSVAIASWKNTVGRADKVFSAFTEGQFLQLGQDVGQSPLPASMLVRHCVQLYKV